MHEYGVEDYHNVDYEVKNITDGVEEDVGQDVNSGQCS